MKLNTHKNIATQIFDFEMRPRLSYAPLFTTNPDKVKARPVFDLDRVPHHISTIHVDHRVDLIWMKTSRNAVPNTQTRVQEECRRHIVVSQAEVKGFGKILADSDPVDNHPDHISDPLSDEIVVFHRWEVHLDVWSKSKMVWD